MDNNELISFAGLVGVSSAFAVLIIMLTVLVLRELDDDDDE